METGLEAGRQAAHCSVTLARTVAHRYWSINQTDTYTHVPN